MLRSCLILIAILGLADLALAQEQDIDIRLSPKVETIIPFYMGASGEVHINNQFELGLGLGFAPSPYVSAVGTVASNLANNPAYTDIIEDSLQNNLIVRATGKMRFYEHWFVGLAMSRLTVSGTSDLNTVGAVATGLDFSDLSNLLQLSGRSTDMDLAGEAYALDLTLGRNFPLHESAFLQVYAGAIKIVSASVDIASQLPNFDNSAIGADLLRQSEAEVENVLLEYGLSPVLGLSMFFYF
jgi:hypothetical protein